MSRGGLPTKPRPLPKPAHTHAWREDGRGAREAGLDYFLTCRCGATMEVTIEQDGVRTEIYEPTAGTGRA